MACTIHPQVAAQSATQTVVFSRTICGWWNRQSHRGVRESRRPSYHG